MNLLTVTNDNGIPFNVVIRPEAPCAGCNKAVHIYDDRFHDWPSWKEFGQFVSSYYTDTILSHRDGEGINLDGGAPDWNLSAENVAAIKEFIKGQEKI